MALSLDFVAELRRHFSGDIRSDIASRKLYSTDASIYQIDPLGVAIPKTQDDLQSAVELASKYNVPILPRGSGSSLAGQAIGQALILDCSRWLDSILNIDPINRTATIEPGTVLSTLNAAASPLGLVFGPDPASAERATMGGVVANNATGAHSILYGMAADHVVSADVILADGTLETWDRRNHSKLKPVILSIRERYGEHIKQNYPHTWRNSAGYRLNYLLPWSASRPSQWIGDQYPANLSHNEWNMAHLLAGSEGTLAVIKSITVNLVPKPKHTILGVLSYASIADACDDVPRLLEFNPSAVELIPQMILTLARSVPAYASQMSWIIGSPAAIMVVEFSGDDPVHLKNKVRSIGEHIVIAETKEDQSKIWNIRKVGLGILDSAQKSDRPVAFIEDCAIPVDHLGEFIREVESILKDHNVEAGIYAHASGGCLHIRPILDLKTTSGVRSLRSISEQVLEVTLELGGSMSSEHGDGLARGEWIEKTYGSELREAFREIKNAADPENLLNPGKLIDAPKMDSNLRFGEKYEARAWSASLNFEHEGGFVGAIEQCNGQGVCRKMTGVMCPSFQATREEKNSTRGRANLLRSLIDSKSNASLSQQSELEEAVHEALELCLGCQGCKAECPSGVDMAKLKFEFKNHYYKNHRRPMRDYIFGYFHIFAKYASVTAPLSNYLMNQSFLKRQISTALGLSQERPFPRFANHRAKPITDSNKIKILYLSDPFTHYIEPEIEQAAFDVLSACGYDVMVLPFVGAGASLYSIGFLDAVKVYAGNMLKAITQADPNGEAAIVGLEPPEIYMLRNDYSSLLPEQSKRIASISSRTWLLEEFLLRIDKIHDLRIANKAIGKGRIDIPQKIKFLPHCHQRAVGPSQDGLVNGSQATLALLRSCGYEVELLDTGCCGMAGAFGFEVEHTEVSMKIGELRLFPELQKDNNIITSTGASCRYQIRTGTQSEVVHPITLIRSAIL